MDSELLQQLGDSLGANGLPYALPVHPNLVHITLGLFIIGIAFDILKFLSLTAVRSNFFDVGWYNVLASAIVTFATVAFGFYEMLLATPDPKVTSAWGLTAMETMLWHGVGGVVLLALMVGMAVWRGFQRFAWRKDMIRQVQWSYIVAGLVIFFLMYVHGTLGAQLAAEFGVHNTADRLLRMGENPNLYFQQ